VIAPSKKTRRLRQVRDDSQTCRDGLSRLGAEGSASIFVLYPVNGAETSNDANARRVRIACYDVKPGAQDGNAPTPCSDHASRRRISADVAFNSMKLGGAGSACELTSSRLCWTAGPPT